MTGFKVLVLVSMSKLKNTIYLFTLFKYRTLENFKLTMATGIPELGMPPLDPIHLELIDFKFFNMTIEFVDVDMEGFKTFTLEKSTVDRTGR